MVKQITTIKITKEVHHRLLDLKIHHAESFNDVIKRLTEEKQ